MLSKSFIIFVLLISLTQIQSCARKNQDEVKEIFNINNKVEVLYFFSKESSYEDQKSFDKKFSDDFLLVKIDNEYRPGVVQAIFAIDKNGYNGFGLTFRPNISNEQREQVFRRLKESPIIFKIYENVVPNEIKDLK